MTSLERSLQLPNTPTVDEAGLPNFEATAWYAIVVPMGVQADIVQKINAVTNRYLRSQSGIDQFGKLGVQLSGGTSEDLRLFIGEEMKRWAPIIKAANLAM